MEPLQNHFVPNQIPLIHVFFYCGGSSGLLIHAYSCHNRSKSGSSVTVPEVRNLGSQDRIQGQSSEHEFNPEAVGALKSDQL